MISGPSHKGGRSVWSRYSPNLKSPSLSPRVRPPSYRSPGLGTTVSWAAGLSAMRQSRQFGTQVNPRPPFPSSLQLGEI